MEYPADGANLGRRSSGCFLFGETGWQAGFVAAVLATSAVALGCAGQRGFRLATCGSVVLPGRGRTGGGPPPAGRG